MPRRRPLPRQHRERRARVAGDDARWRRTSVGRDAGAGDGARTGRRERAVVVARDRRGGVAVDAAAAGARIVKAFGKGVARLSADRRRTRRRGRSPYTAAHGGTKLWSITERMKDKHESCVASAS